MTQDLLTKCVNHVLGQSVNYVTLDILSAPTMLNKFMLLKMKKAFA